MRESSVSLLKGDSGRTTGMLEVAQAFCPEIILLDIGMPRLNGYDTYRLIREHPWGTDIKIVAMIGWGQGEDKRCSQGPALTTTW